METNDVTRTTMLAGALVLTVWPEAPLGEHQRYGYRIRDAATGQEIEGRDLFTGTGGPMEPARALRDLAGYLSAAGEARQYALDHPSTAFENTGPFPDWLAETVRDHPQPVAELAAWDGPVSPVSQRGPGKELARRWLHVVSFDAWEDERGEDLFEDIERGAIDHVMGYLKEHDFGNDLDDPKVRELIGDEIALRPTSEVVVDGEYVLVHDQQTRCIDFYRKVPLAHVEPEPQRWISVVFLQGAEADDVLDLIDRQGPDAAIEHLAGYDFGEETVQAALENGYVYDDLPTGTVDEVAVRDVYTLSYNHHLGHVSLLREYDALPDPVLLGIDTPATPQPPTPPAPERSARREPHSIGGRDWFEGSSRTDASGRGLGL